MSEQGSFRGSKQMSYRFRRRSFLAGIGGAFGLEILLRNLEAKAQGVAPPPRFLMMHWPCGTIRNQFIPTGTGTGYSTSKSTQGPGYIISPFDTPELRSNTIALHGLNSNFRGYGGAHEDGTVFVSTGANSPGTRNNGGELDDGCAGGASWDQIFLKNVPALARRNANGSIIGPGYANATCDARVDSFELSTRCLSYGYTRRSIASANPGGTVVENVPLMPSLHPLTLYNSLFSGFIPGGVQSEAAAVERLARGGSVLDASTAELARLAALAPASERATIDANAEVIRKLEQGLEETIDAAGTVQGCTLPGPPSGNLAAKQGNFSDYGNPTSTIDDGPLIEALGQAHAAIIRAAFACDVIRVATLQWAPGTNHVAFRGMDPSSANTIYIHHPLSHRNGSVAFYDSPRPATDTYIWDVMVNVNRWYFQKTANIINQFRQQLDPLDPNGGSLLDRTVIPLVTEVGNPGHTRSGHGALIFGGRRLGMQGGQYASVTGIHNRLWGTVAQAYLGASWANALAAESYVKTGATPIPGLWVAPP